MVFVHNRFPRAHYSIRRGHGLFNRNIVHDVDPSLYVHSAIQLENDQTHGGINVRFLLFIRTRLFGI